MVVTSTSSVGAAGLLYGPTGPVPSVGTKNCGRHRLFHGGPLSPADVYFPFISPQVCSTMNYGQLTYLMYRPLYWFGNNNSRPSTPATAFANMPTFKRGGKNGHRHLEARRCGPNGEQVTSPRMVDVLDEHDVRR